MIVLADLFLFLQFVDRLFDVAADVAHGRAMVFQYLMEMLHDFLAALFGGRGHRHAHDLAVVRRVQPQVRCPDGLVDQRHHARVPGRNHDQRCVRYHDRAQLIHGHRRAVVIHADIVQYGRIRAAGAQRSYFLAKIVHGFFHARLGRGHRVSCISKRRHDS